MYALKLIFKIILRIVVIVLFVIAVLAVAFNWPTKSKNEEMKFHLAFSNTFASAIGVDWREAYQTILDELKPEKVRVAAYWDEIERVSGEYDFSSLDYQIDQAKERGVRVVLALGIKVPRWPECYIPGFYQENKVAREEAILEYEKVLINRYKSYENIEMWQVENEPFLPFGACQPDWVDAQLVDREIALVRSLDPSRPIMVTDSGELSLWVEAAKRSDIFGTTLYRIIHKEPYGYIKYPLGPSFFRIKAWVARIFANQENIIISELQAEPWGPGWFPDMTLEEQYKSMSPKKLEEIAAYARRTKFQEAYLWGAEWWYWLKVKSNNQEMWETAKSLISGK